ncbi:MAG: signal recognition particle protein [Chloroflexota bacterium]|nr:signal recognition particle protein [Chloroflexota bacterium]MDE2883768.1 signal recognition particle protein [Chloroflexota bacterium]
MFDTLTDKLTAVFNRVGNKGRLTDEDVDEALREVRLALLEADVNFRVARDFTAKVKERAAGSDLLRGVSPGQQVVKLVHDQLVELLGEGDRSLTPGPTLPAVLMLVGLQGSGKTTAAAKLALLLRKRQERSLLIAGDLRRPAAMDQLETLGRQLDIPVYRENAGPDSAPSVVQNGLRRAREMGVKWALVDTGGRIHADEELMEELAEMRRVLQPAEVLMVLDAMTGQDAVNAAVQFNERIALTGLILSKLDGDARGGAALSATHVTGVPVKFAGTGEKPDALEPFHPERMASRILGMGDIVTLVERAQEQTTEEQAAELERKMRRAELDLNDFLNQLRQLQRMGPLSSILEMVPGARGLRSRLPAGAEGEQRLRRTEAIISSMTMWERRHPERINGSRRKRIAVGSGTNPSDVNQVLSQFQQMRKMMKQLASGRKGSLRGLGLPGF